MHIKTVPVAFKAGPDDGLGEGEFIVYPSTFTETPDAYGDVVMPGAFLNTIEEWKASGNVLPGLYGHRMDDPDYYVASAIDQGEDDHGWWVKGVFDLENPKAMQTYRLVKGKRITQLSFAYDTIQESFRVTDDGQKLRELRELKVYEFSFVPIGANQDTSVVAVKSLAEQAHSLATAVKAGRVLSAKNEGKIRDARDALDQVLAAIGEDDTAEGKATEQPDAKTHAPTEEPSGAKAGANVEEPKAGPSVALLAADVSLYELA